MEEATLTGRRRNWEATKPARYVSWKSRKCFALTLFEENSNVKTWLRSTRVKLRFGGNSRKSILVSKNEKLRGV
jgi:hypothetical protein